MRKLNPLFIISLLFVLVLSLGSCKDKPKPNNETGFERSLTNQDSVEVVKLVDQFFSYIENGKSNEAAAMLVKLDPEDKFAEPQPLSNEDLRAAEQLYGALPIKSHYIDYVKFSETYDNEVKVTALIAPAENGNPEVKTVFYFKPVNYLKSWKLSIIDTNSNDHPIIDGGKRDSMEKEYAKEMRQKAMSERKEKE